MARLFEHGTLLTRVGDIQSAHFEVLKLLRSKLDEKLRKDRTRLPLAQKLAPAALQPPARPASGLLQGRPPAVPDASAGAAAGAAAADEVAARRRRRVVRATLRMAVESECKRLQDMSGGVCHGMTYAWFHSLQSGQTTLRADSVLHDFDRRRELREEFGRQALENQALLNYHAAANSELLDGTALRQRAARKLAEASGFDESVAEAALAMIDVTPVTLRLAFERLIVDRSPRLCYRLSMQTPAGNHSMGVVYQDAHLYLLDPNHGIFRYAWGGAARQAFIDDLHDALVTRPPGQGGYGIVSLTLYRAEPVPPPSAEPAGDPDAEWQRLLAEFTAPEPAAAPS